MSDQAKPPRRRFQMHLSTALVLMIAAGFLTLANVADSRFELMNGKALFNFYPPLITGFPASIEMECSFEKFQQSPEFTEWTGDSELYFGWPFDAKVVTGPVGAKNRDRKVVRLTETIADHSTNTFMVRGKSSQWFAKAVAANALIALAILGAIGFVSEWWIRRREARVHRTNQ